MGFLPFEQLAIFGGMLFELNDKFRLAADYLHFRLHANSRFTIHSPFLFELVNDIFRDKRHFYAFEEIENIRKKLLADKSVIEGNDLGERSKTLWKPQRQLSDVVKTASLPAQYGRLLFRTVDYLRPANILEIGTSAGISTLYLASAASSVPFITLEGSLFLSKIAREQIAAMKLNNVTVITGIFNDTLKAALQQLGKVGFVFIDGDHRKSSLLNYVQQCLPHIYDESVMVIDDIYWSGDMKEAWAEIISMPQVTMSIDLFRLGILFFREGIKKQHLKVVY